MMSIKSNLEYIIILPHEHIQHTFKAHQCVNGCFVNVNMNPVGGGGEANDDSEEESGTGWISWFCDLEGHEFFIEVDEEYIRDNFNLHGLKERVNFYNDGMTIEVFGKLELNNKQSPDQEDLEDQNFLEIYQSAMDLYGLIHARFIISPRGLALMKEKFILGSFGYCPRVLCERQSVLPIGVSEELSTSRVKVYCPRCQDVYIPRSKQLDIDGAYFGTSFPHIFMKTYPELIPSGPPKFIPKIYGFKIFGMRGSKYELRFDSKGQPVNEEDIRQVLNNFAQKLAS